MTGLDSQSQELENRTNWTGDESDDGGYYRQLCDAFLPRTARTRVARTSHINDNGSNRRHQVFKENRIEQNRVE